jgi:hypothetical protein
VSHESARDYLSGFVTRANSVSPCKRITQLENAAAAHPAV